MASIPASQLVSVNPGVIGPGGSPLSLNAILLTKNRAVPIGALQSFPTSASVLAFFGAGSTEAALAAIYFSGFDNSNIKPGSLLFFNYADVAVAAWLRGATNAYTLAQIQTFKNAVVTGSIAGTTLTVSAAGTPGIVSNMILTGTGVTAGTRVVTQLTGTAGGVGTYSVDTSQTVSSTAITGAFDLQVTVDGVAKSFATIDLSASTSLSDVAARLTTALTSGVTVTYDATRAAFQINSPTTGAASTVTYATGAIASRFNFTAALGAVISQGSALTTPGAAMAVAANVSQNWGSFFTTWEPNTADKTLFAVWVNAQNDRFAYIAWDTDVTATTSVNTTCFGGAAGLANYDGVIPVYDPTSGGGKAAFIAGAIASVDFTQLNGRVTFAYKGQSGLTADVTDATVAANLIANNYNFYGSYATAAQSFVMLQDGGIVGRWLWIDPYINQIYLNSQFQLALMTLLTSVKSLPYNSLGYGLIRAALMDPINQGVNFGSIRAGVPLSALQAAEVNAAAGLAIDGYLTNQGWYLQILPASTQVRGARTSPPCTFWYMDGGSIQKINLASIDVF